MPRARLRLVSVALGAAILTAHIGTQDVVFDGRAGPYPVRVVVRPAGVVPGLAQISVRVLAGSPTDVRVQAAPAELGSGAAPKAESMTAVPGETGLYTADLWLMTTGAYAVRIELEGQEGQGALMLPVTSVATRRLGMDSATGWALAVLGMLLVAGAVTIVHRALRDAVVPAGERPTDEDLRRGRIGMLAAGVIFITALVGGSIWWRAEDSAYARTIDRPLAVKSEVSVRDGAATLRLRVVDTLLDGNASAPLIPDHGKMMHLFLARERSLDALAHLHPTREGKLGFATPLPSALPPGRYHAYGDIVHETGLARTLVAVVDVPASLSDVRATDPDDSWLVGAPLSTTPPASGSLTSALPGGGSMTWERAGALVAGPETSLRIVVRDASGEPAALQPYMGMRGHAIVMRDDGRVFVHLHPAGTISMGAQQRLEEVERGPKPHDGAAHAISPVDGEAGVVKFPFAFPAGGRYRVWVQVRMDGAVQTAAFDTRVGGE